jgi:SWI/SNF-related matrix-associated actin-dependent regulator 1 of chromatin subfamily A
LRSWWTEDAVLAHQLADQADAGAQLALEPLAKQIDRSRASEPLESMPKPSSPEGWNFYPYQAAGVQIASERKRILIADECGLGKTPSAVGVINEDPTIETVLVVCPASLKVNWRRELERWMVRPLEIGLARPKDPAPDTPVVICGYEQARKPETHDKLMARSWGVLILDEAQRLRNPKTKQTKAILGSHRPKSMRPGFRRPRERVPGLIDRARYVLPLSATPIENRTIDLWPILNALDPEAFPSRWKFGMRFGDGKRTSWGWNLSGSSRLPELQTRLRSGLMIRRLTKDVLDLPKLTREIVKIDPQSNRTLVEQEQAALSKTNRFEELEQDLSSAVARGDSRAYQRTAKELDLRTKAAFKDFSKIRRDTAVAKIGAVIEHTHKALEQTDKLLLFGHHQQVLQAFTKEFGDMAVTLTGQTSTRLRQGLVDRFQTKDDCRVFIGSIRAAGVGLTLTAASLVLFAEFDLCPSWMIQSEKRAHRIGQKKDVLVRHLVWDGSLDVRLVQILLLKQHVAEQGLDATSDQLKQTDMLSRGARRISGCETMAGLGLGNNLSTRSLRP